MSSEPQTPPREPDEPARETDGGDLPDPGREPVPASMLADSDTPLDVAVRATVARWCAESESRPETSASRLALLAAEPSSAAFAREFLDSVVRPADRKSAAAAFERLASSAPETLPWFWRAAILAGGTFAPVAAGAVVPVARRAFREAVGQLVIDESDNQLAKRLAEVTDPGTTLDVWPVLTDRPAGARAADEALDRVGQLIDRPEIVAVTIDLDTVLAPQSDWGFAQAQDAAVERLLPLLRRAVMTGTAITLAPGRGSRRDLVVSVFCTLLDDPSLAELDAGISISAAFTDASAVARELHAWARGRAEQGRPPIRIRVVTDHRVDEERAEAAVTGRSATVVATAHDEAANAIRIIDWLLTPDRVAAARVSVAGHDVVVLATAIEIARRRGIVDQLRAEVTLGRLPVSLGSVAAEVSVSTLVPRVAPRDFAEAVPYLIDALNSYSDPIRAATQIERVHRERPASPKSGATDGPLTDLSELSAFTEIEASITRVLTEAFVPTESVTALVTRSDGAEVWDGVFRNSPLTDPSLAGDRAWIASLTERVATAERPVPTGDAIELSSAGQAHELVVRTAAAAAPWQGISAGDRAATLHDAADVLAAYRARLIEVLAVDADVLLPEGDRAVSDAVDAINYAAERGRELHDMRNVTFEPVALVLVAVESPWGLGALATDAAAALAAGSAVLMVAEPRMLRAASLLRSAMIEAGVPESAVVLASLAMGSEIDVERALVSDVSVGRAVLNGTRNRAAQWRAWRPAGAVQARVPGRGIAVITGSADLDAAVADVVEGFVAGNGRDPRGTRAVIIAGNGEVADLVRSRLVDAVGSVTVGEPAMTAAQLGPIPGGAHLGAPELSVSGVWLVSPEPAGDALWQPGLVSIAPQAESLAAVPERVPVLALIEVRSLSAALELIATLPDGAVTALHSQSADDIDRWAWELSAGSATTGSVPAGELVVNGSTVGGRVRRRPAAAADSCSIGLPMAAGGPNELLRLGDWRPIEIAPRQSLSLRGIGERAATVLTAAQAALDFTDFDEVRRAARDDQRWWERAYGIADDVTDLQGERNVTRYRPVPVTLRLGEGRPLRELVRLLVAAALTGSPITVSTATPLPHSMIERMVVPLPMLALDVPLADDPTASVSEVVDQAVVVESDLAFAERLAASAVLSSRVRVAGDSVTLWSWLASTPEVTVIDSTVTSSGRIELLNFVQEQTVTVPTTRFGRRDPRILELEL